MALGPGNKRITGTSPAAASTALSQTVGGLAGYDLVTVFAKVQGATGGTLDVYLQGSFDDGVTWYEVAHLPQLAAAAAQRTYKLTFSLSSAITAVGEGTSGSAGTAVVAANTIVAGHPGDLLRVVYVAGASTSAGATQTFNIHGTNARR